MHCPCILFHTFKHTCRRHKTQLFVIFTGYRKLMENVMLWIIIIICTEVVKHSFTTFTFKYDWLRTIKLCVQIFETHNFCVAHRFASNSQKLCSQSSKIITVMNNNYYSRSMKIVSVRCLKIPINENCAP